MRRALAILAAAGLVVGGTAALGAGESDERPSFDIVLENSFGLTEGADFRVTGVRVGSVDDLEVDSRTAHAIAKVKVEEQGFGSLTRDAQCSVQPQSLIGEYYLNCEPGRGARLRDGDRIPVEQTSGTVSPDLVASIMTRPIRERFGLLLAELGAAVGARGPDINASIRRAIPALRETDRVLRVLADEKETLQALTRDADVVIGRLADGREDVSRFVSEARDTAAASASRRGALQASVARFPQFQRELRPVLRDLSTVAREQTPALRDLRNASGELTTLLRRLGPFTEATVPALRSLGAASVIGRRAVRAADDTVETLRRTARRAPEPLTNLRFVGEHIDDRGNAVETNPLSPEGKGFTGLEAFLQYPYVQAQAINLFDDRGYTLKLNALLNECTGYTNADGALRNPGRTQRCQSLLGPGSPKLEPMPATAQEREAARQRSAAQTPAAPGAPAQPGAQSPGQGPATPQLPSVRVPEIKLPGLPPIKLPSILGGNRDGGQGTSSGTPTGLLDFLLGP
ncbi:MAG TPA: MlaD family protein [Baekduia sp.]|nr:MlaD family protein [Baekduia sp.]